MCKAGLLTFEVKEEAEGEKDDIFAQTDLDYGQGDGDNIDYGCCGDNLPMPQFGEDGTATALEYPVCILKPQQVQQ